jgi:hypothetical protein
MYTPIMLILLSRWANINCCVVEMGNSRQLAKEFRDAL